MANKKVWVVELITQIIGDKIKAEIVVDRLMEEGLLVLGYGDADIDKVVEAFKMTFGTTKVTKYDRFAANRLVKNYGSQSVCGIIGLLAKRSTEAYAPVVGSIAQLETKWVSVLHFLRQAEPDDERIQL
jgi:hypothetical protein